MSSIDVHSHFMPRSLLDALANRTGVPRVDRSRDHQVVVCGTGVDYPVPHTMFEFEAKMDELDEAEIDVALLSPGMPGLDWLQPGASGGLTRDVNDELIDLCTGEARAQPLVCLPMQDPAASVDELERTKALGARGAIVFSNVAGMPLHDRSIRPVFEAAEAIDMPLVLHPTTPRFSAGIARTELVAALGFVFDSSVAAVELILDGVYERHPRLKLILVHAGGILPFVSGRLDHFLDGSLVGDGAERPVESLKRLYVDTASASAATVAHCLSFFGSHHVMFGTDAPFWDPSECVAAIGAADVETSEFESIMQCSAARVFGLQTETKPMTSTL